MYKSVFTGRDAFKVNHRLLREERVGGKARHQIHREAGHGPVPGVLNLGHVLQFVVDGLNQGPLAQKDSVRYGHDLSLHIALQLRNQLDAVHEELGEEILADVPLVADKFSEDLLDEGFVPQRLAVIDIAGREHKVQEVSLLVADEMQFEAVEPSHRALATLGKPFEHLVDMDSLIPADAQRRAVHETDSGAAAHAAPLHEQDEGNCHFLLQLYEAVVGYGIGKQVLHVLANLINIEVFQAFVSAQMEQNHNGYDLGIGQDAVPMILPLRLVTLAGKSVNLDESVIKLAEIIRHTENFSNFVIVDRHSERFCFGVLDIPNLQKLSLFS